MLHKIHLTERKIIKVNLRRNYSSDNEGAPSDKQ